MVKTFAKRKNKENSLLDQEHIEKEADRIMRNNPVGYFLKEFEYRHVGDLKVAILLLLSIACQSIRNSKGIQVSVIGKSTGGKTDCCREMLRLMPKEYQQTTSLSQKAIWRLKEDWKPGTVIFSNDVKLSEEMEEVIKRATDVFKSGDDSYTVLNTKRKPEALPIPKRLTWWLTSVNASENEQLLNRFYTVRIDESEKQDKRVFDRQKKSSKPSHINEVKICQEIILKLKKHRKFNVLLNEDFLDNNINWKDDLSDRRRFESFKELIKAFAVLRYKRRPEFKGKIVAIIKDYENAVKLYNEIRGLPQLNEDELEVWRIIYELTKKNFTYSLIEPSKKEEEEGHRYYPAWIIAQQLGWKNPEKSGADRVRKILKRLEEKLPPNVILKEEDSPPTGGRTYRYAALVPPDGKIKLVKIKKEPLPESYIEETANK